MQPSVMATGLGIAMARAVLAFRQRQGSVAMMTGVMAPVLLMSTAMGIEVAWWSTAKVELQRTADLAAWAGAMTYAGSRDALRAARTAVDLAEINQTSGTVSRGWNAASLMLTDGLITAQIVSGVRDASQNAVKVTVKRTMATSFSRIFPSVGPSVTVTAEAVAEIGIIEAGPQPCMTALGKGVDGITTGSDTTFSGNVDLNAVGCALRSNTGITKNGNGIVRADGVYAGGSISSRICCDVHPDSGQIPDPYANFKPLNDAFAFLGGSSAGSVSVSSNSTRPLAAGTSGGWTVNGTLTLAAGLYVVNGNISVGAQGTISGTGVTIVTSGTVSMNGGSTLSLTAATTNNAQNNAVPGVLLAGTSHGSVTVAGNAAPQLTGLVYFPHASLKFAGASSAGSGGGCLQVMASSITMVGTADLEANCSAYGMLEFGSLPAAKTVALVQ
jgi:Flp pilus assembly protein TadG